MTDTTHLLILGSHPDLSHIELQKFGTIISYDKENKILLIKNLQIPNPRGLPKSLEQVWLDQLGGTIRIGKIIQKTSEKKEIPKIFAEIFSKQESRQTYHLGLSSFGIEEYQSLHEEIFKNIQQETALPIRQIKNNQHALTSGQIFREKLLKKGIEFIVYKKNNEYFLAQTFANQNLRNYELRDYRKPFRDTKMGMTPPKLAQIMINIGMQKFRENFPKKMPHIIDPFCGSGTFVSESLIMGYDASGSDLEARHIKGAKENLGFLSEKFRFEANENIFKVADGLTRKYKGQKNCENIIITEGWLGENFDHHPNKEERKIMTKSIFNFWKKVLHNAYQQSINLAVICLPSWKNNKIFSQISKNLAHDIRDIYDIVPLDNIHQTYLYQREKTFTAREIVVFKRQE